MPFLKKRAIKLGKNKMIEKLLKQETIKRNKFNMSKYSEKELVRGLYSETRLRVRFKNSLKGVYKKIRSNLGKIGLGIYEGVLAKYIYDLNVVLSDGTVRRLIWRGRLPVGTRLFPWPELLKIISNTSIGKMPGFLFTRPMTEIEKWVAYFGYHPELQVGAIAVPLIAYGIYYGIKRYGGKK